MAYIVQQLRKVNNLNTYRTENPISVAVEEQMIETLPSFSTGNISHFLDYTVIPSTVLTVGEVYFLEYEICKIPEGYYNNGTGSSYNPDELNIDIVIKDSSSTRSEVENIGSITVPAEIRDVKGQDGNYSVKENFTQKVKGTLIFSPTTNCDRLGFKINRTGYDYLVSQRNWLIDPVLNPPAEGQTTMTISIVDSNNNLHNVTVPYNKIQITNLCSLKNLVSNRQWLKFGFQSRPGTLIAVNGEPIVVGRSGVYEINNGTKISKFMIATPGNDINKVDAFLLDYAYETNS